MSQFFSKSSFLLFTLSSVFLRAGPPPVLTFDNTLSDQAIYERDSSTVTNNAGVTWDNQGKALIDAAYILTLPSGISLTKAGAKYFLGSSQISKTEANKIIATYGGNHRKKTYAKEKDIIPSGQIGERNGKYYRNHTNGNVDVVNDPTMYKEADYTAISHTSSEYGNLTRGGRDITDEIASYTAEDISKLPLEKVTVALHACRAGVTCAAAAYITALNKRLAQLNSKQYVDVVVPNRIVGKSAPKKHKIKHTSYEAYRPNYNSGSSNR
jgi:hypothetical protein